MIERAVVVLEIQVELVRIAPVELAVRGEVELRKLFEGGALVAVRERQQLVPVVLRQAPLVFRYLAIVGHRPVARQHSRAQELRAVGRRRELEVAIQMARRNAFVECVDEGIDFQARHAALHFHARHQPQRHGRDHAEQSVAAHHVAKQLGMFRAAAAHDFAGRRHHFEPFDVRDERLGSGGRGHEYSPTPRRRASGDRRRSASGGCRMRGPRRAAARGSRESHPAR